MISLDTNSSVTQSLVDQLVNSSTVNGAFSLAAFESELSSVVNQVLSQAVAVTAQASGSQAGSGVTSNTDDTTFPSSGTSTGSGRSQNVIAAQSQQPAAPAQPILAMFGGGLVSSPPPVVFQSGDLLTNRFGNVSLAPASTSISTVQAPPVDASMTNAAPADTGSTGKMVKSYDPFWGNLAGPLVPASGETWTNPSTGKSFDSGAVTAGLESRYGAGSARMLTVLYNQFGPGAYGEYVSAHPDIDFTTQSFAFLPPMTAFQFYGPKDSFVDPNNQTNTATSTKAASSICLGQVLRTKDNADH